MKWRNTNQGIKEICNLQGKFYHSKVETLKLIETSELLTQKEEQR